jgi:tetratricopeptide (TPR) repeat protein
MRRLVLAVVVALAARAALAQGADALADARARLEDAAFEEALSAIDALLSQDDLDAEVRVQARVLRAQALVALGDTKKAEAEWAAILEERPGFRPDPAAVPAKALARFEALRAAKVGTVRLDLDPKDATLALDGKPVGFDPDGTLSVLAGTHTLRAERSGFDPAEATLAVGASGTLDLVLRLTPNARTVVVVVEPAGAEVLLDGRPVGVAQVPVGGGTPSLVLPDLPLGDHAFELRLPCHRSLHVNELLTVDLLDRSPRRLGPFHLESARGILAPSGLDGAMLAVDGAQRGVLPLAPFEACAGPRRVEVVRSGRRLWVGTVEVPEGEEAPLTLAARPNLVVLGGEAPPWTESWSVELQDGDVDPSQHRFAADVDLVWGPAVAWSPWLQAEIPLPDTPLLEAPPSRARGTLGVGLADGSAWGTGRIVRLRAGGPAAQAGVRLGERIVAIAGKPIASAREADAAIAVLGDDPVGLTLESGKGQTREVRVTPTTSPLLLPPPAGPPEAALRAAWAAAQAAARPEDPAAAADLALALAAGGRAEAAVEQWRARAWPAREGIGEGTAAYFLGRALQAGGKVAEAARALAVAARSHATAEADDGPPIAPAAKSP